MGLVATERHFDSLHAKLELLKMSCLLLKCIVMQCFVNEPHESVQRVFIHIRKEFYAQHNFKDNCEKRKVSKTCKFDVNKLLLTIENSHNMCRYIFIIGY